MSQPSFKWHFPSTDNGDEDGINDPLREVFEGDHERYVARESIQNSLDARKDNNKPVLVKFERHNLPTNEVPGLDELKDILKRAKDYSKDQDKSESFYGGALKMLEQETIPILKVGDYNTVGLGGDDHNQNGRWYKLIRSSGVNSMQGVGGGSFGIGKGAPFAASGLRTVFYSTINEEGEHVFQGKARLSSYVNEAADVRRGVGAYGFAGEKGVVSVRDINSTPEFFRRAEQGTDFYIIGYQTLEEDWTRLLLNSLLNNFWAAIHFDELDVELYDNGKLIHKVNEDNLEELMSEYASEEGGSYNFYKSVVEPTKVIKHDLPTLKSVSLYVRTEEKYPKAVQLMRKSKMVIDTISKYRVLPEPYAAVFICDSEEGNQILRDLEPPAHDKWDPERHDNKQFGRKVHKELYDWIKTTLRDMAEDKEVAPEDIPELSKWLPEEEERDDMNPYLGSTGDITEGNTDIETGREIGATQETKDADSANIRKREVALTKSLARGGSETPLGVADRTNKTHDATVDPDSPGSLPRISTVDISFRAREITRNGQRAYQAVVTSESEQSGALKVVAIGDDVNYPIDLDRVEDENGKIVDINGPMIKELKLEAGKPMRLYLKLKSDKRYAIGVE